MMHSGFEELPHPKPPAIPWQAPLETGMEADSHSVEPALEPENDPYAPLRPPTPYEDEADTSAFAPDTQYNPPLEDTPPEALDDDPDPSDNELSPCDAVDPPAATPREHDATIDTPVISETEPQERAAEMLDADTPPPKPIVTAVPRLTPEGEIQADYPHRTPDRDLEIKIAKYYKSLDTQRDRQHLEGETILTDRERSYVKAAERRYTMIGERLGAGDLTPRFVELRHYRMFDDEETYEAAVQQVNKTLEGRGQIEPGTAGFCSSNIGITVLRNGFYPRTNAHLGHELGHAVAADVYIPGGSKENPGRLQHHSGYTDISPALNEIVTDMLYAQNTRMAGGGRYLGYLALDLVADAAIREVADRAGVPPQKVDDALSRGYLNGSRAGVNAFERYLGTDRATAIYNMPLQMDEEQAYALAEDLELPDAMRQLDNLNNNRPCDAFTWQEPPYDTRGAYHAWW